MKMRKRKTAPALAGAQEESPFVFENQLSNDGAKVLSCVYPPAMAPTIRSTSSPLATLSGRGVSIGSSERSSLQAKKRTKGLRCRVIWSRIVPFSMGYSSSSLSSTERMVTSPSTSSRTSWLILASSRKCPGMVTLIMAVFAPQPKAQAANSGRWLPMYLQNCWKRTPALR